MQITPRKIRPQSNLHILLVPFRCPLSHSSKKLYLNVPPLSQSNDFLHVERFLIALVCSYKPVSLWSQTRLPKPHRTVSRTIRMRWINFSTGLVFNYLQTDSIPEVRVQLTASTGDEVQWDSVCLCMLDELPKLYTALNIWRPTFKAFAGLGTNLRLRVPASYFQNTQRFRRISLLYIEKPEWTLRNLEIPHYLWDYKIN